MRGAKIALGIMLLILGVLQYRLWLSPDGIQEVWRLDAAVQKQKEAIKARQLRNQSLEAEVLDLKEGIKAAEERARGELGMVGSQETFYRVVESSRER